MSLIREAQVIAGPFTIWVETNASGEGAWRFITDIAPVMKRFKGQRYSKLIGWLASKYGHCESIPLVREEKDEMSLMGGFNL